MKKTLIILGWLVLWQLLSLVVNNNILLVGPFETLQELFRLIPTLSFWQAIANTLLKVILGYLIGFLLAVVLALLSYKYSLLEDILKPLVSALKSIPVVSMIVLIIIWIGNKNVSIFVSATVVFPIIYSNVLTGLRSVDEKMMEMAQVFALSQNNIRKYIMIPHMKEYLLAAFSLSWGMAWKSSVAAEVIGQPLNTIGNELYKSKIYLNTAGVYSWTLTIVLVCWLLEKLILHFIKETSHD